MKAPTGAENQPVSNVDWVTADRLWSNDYNPNHVFESEMRLLRESIMSDGWVFPIYARLSGEIIDGYHRWLLVSRGGEVAALTDGLLPVVWAPEDITPVDQRAATVRLNRARGYHAVLDMSRLVTELMDEHGLDAGDMEQMFGMEREEVERLYDTGGADLNPDDEEPFSEGWVVADPNREGA